MTSKIIYIGGVSASGKTSTVQSVVERLNQKYPGQIEHINGGTELKKIAQEVFGKNVNSLNKRQLAKIRTLLYQRAVDSTANVVLFVHHFTHAPKTSAEQRAILPNRPFSSILLPHVKHFILIESQFNSVRTRRIVDRAKKPRRIGYKDILRGIVSQRIVARAVALEQHMSLTIVTNKEGRAQQTVRQIERIVRRHL